MITEEQIHLELVERVRLTNARTLFWHTPNSGLLAPQYRRKVLALGMLPGVPDLLFFTPPKILREVVVIDPHDAVLRVPYVGAALELKSDDGTLKDSQRDVLDQLHELGWTTAVTYGLDAGIAKLREWGYIR